MDITESGEARLLAVRDEDPQRAWDALGPWWPEQYPGVIGIRDRRAGGAWLAANPAERRLAVLLNRADMLAAPESEVHSRGGLALESVAGRRPLDLPHTHGFNLLEIAPEGSRVLSWNGLDLHEHPVTPGVHMIAHDDLDDPATPRIAEWLPTFRAQRPSLATGDWPTDWLTLLQQSAALPAEDDRAIIRDNRTHGYPTLSLLYCVASVTDDGIALRDVTLDVPGHLSADGH